MYKITKVSAGDGDTLHLTYSDGTTVHADLTPFMAQVRETQPNVFAGLLDRQVFEQVSVGRRGRTVEWPGEFEPSLDADVFRMADGDPDKPTNIRTISTTEGTPPNPVSAQVAQAIAGSGLTQVEIAERAGMLQPALSRLTNPDYHGHSLDALRRIAEATGQELVVEFRSRAG